MCFSLFRRYSINDLGRKIKYMENKKAPIGIMSLEFHDQERFNNLCEAIQRYLDSEKLISIKWIEEYNDFLKKYKGEKEFSL